MLFTCATKLLFLITIMGNYRLKKSLYIDKCFIKVLKIYFLYYVLNYILNLTLKYGWRNKAEPER